MKTWEQKGQFFLGPYIRNDNKYYQVMADFLDNHKNKTKKKKQKKTELTDYAEKQLFNCTETYYIFCKKNKSHWNIMVTDTSCNLP